MIERAAKLTIILGANGTGKTSILRKLLAYLQSKDVNFKSLIITPDDIEWNHVPEVELTRKEDFTFRGISKHVFNPSVTLNNLSLFKKGYLVFDDCRAYLKASTADQIHALLVRRRQREVDVFAVGHGFNEVPPVFFTFASEIILFRTADNIARRKNCLKDFDKMVEAQQRVNRKAEKDPHYFEVIKFA